MKYLRLNSLILRFLVFSLFSCAAVLADPDSSKLDVSSLPGQSEGNQAPSVRTKDSAQAAKTTPSTSEESDVIEMPRNFLQSSTLVADSGCKVKCLNPHAATSEAGEVIDTLQKIYKAYCDKDFDYIGAHLAQDCITFYEGDKKLISGKKAALDDIREWTEKEAQKKDSPLLEITLDHPYCNVNQDHAVITFTAIKEIGGTHPEKFKSHVNDVFKKDGTSWLLLTHYRSNWNEMN